MRHNFFSVLERAEAAGFELHHRRQGTYTLRTPFGVYSDDLYAIDRQIMIDAKRRTGMKNGVVESGTAGTAG